MDIVTVVLAIDSIIITNENEEMANVTVVEISVSGVVVHVRVVVGS